MVTSQLVADIEQNIHILKKACEALVTAVAFFSDVQTILVDGVDFKVLERLIDQSRIQSALRTDLFESRIHELENKLMLQSHNEADSMLYFKRLQIAERIETIAASSKCERMQSGLRRKPSVRRNLRSASFIDCIQTDAYLAEIERLLENKTAR